LMRESMIRMEMQKQNARDPLTEHVTPSAMQDQGLLEDALTRHSISPWPTAAKPGSKETASPPPKTRYRGESAADYVKSMHADYYVQCDSSLDDAVISEKEGSLHDAQKTRMSTLDSTAFAESLEASHHGLHHAPWAPSLADTQLRPPATVREHDALGVTRARVQALRGALDKESARSPKTSPAKPSSPALAEDPDLTPLQRVRARVEAMNDAQTTERISDKVHDAQTITWDPAAGQSLNWDEWAEARMASQAASQGSGRSSEAAISAAMSRGAHTQTVRR